MIYVIRNVATGYLEGAGTGNVVPGTGQAVIYLNTTLDLYKAAVQALPNWGGDWRFVKINADGTPADYVVRVLTPEEQLQDDNNDLMAVAQTLLTQIDATLASYQTTYDNWASLTQADQIAHLKNMTLVVIKMLQVLKFYIRKGM